jgi:hypothetical protein
MTLYEIEEHIGTLIPEADLPTDQDLAKCREESHRWIQYNRIKSRPVPVSRSKGGRKKSSRNPSPQRPQRPQRPKSRQGQVHKAKETVPEKKPIENPGQGKSHPPAPDKVSEAKKPQEKPSGTLKNSAKTQQKTAEKSLLHRITGRLFGK